MGTRGGTRSSLSTRGNRICTARAGIKCRVNFQIFRMRLDGAHACAAMLGEPDMSEASREIRYYNLASDHKYYCGDASITL